MGIGYQIPSEVHSRGEEPTARLRLAPPSALWAAPSGTGSAQRSRSWEWEKREESSQSNAQLFEEMNLLPYYPKGVLVSGRAKISRGQKVRVAIYPNPYPNFEGKIIKEFEV